MSVIICCLVSLRYVKELCHSFWLGCYFVWSSLNTDGLGVCTWTQMLKLCSEISSMYFH